MVGNTEAIRQSPRGGQPPLCSESWTSNARHGNQGLEQVLENSRGDKISSMLQPQVVRTGVVQLRLGQKRLLLGPILLALSAWFISLPSTVFGLFWCLHWMVPKSPAHLPIPEFLAYAFSIILWIGSALAAIATISSPLGVAAILRCLVSILWPRTPFFVRVITIVVFVLCIVGSWRIQAQIPNPTFPF
jgi:hypothetical protein